MVADKIDMSLDDIIASNRRSNRGGRGGRGGGRGGRGGFRGGRGRSSSNFRSGGGPVRRGRGGNRSTPYTRPKNLPDRWDHDMYDGAGARSERSSGGRRSEGLSTGSHLQIANLDFGVTESDIKELFSEFGKLKKAIINYDTAGRSHGTADVVFERKADALKAYNTYNGVPLDGRPMKIEVVTAVRVAAPAVTSMEQSNNTGRRRFSGGFRGSSNTFRGRSGNGYRGSRGGRGRGGSRGGRRGGDRDVPSKDELDKELDSYVVKGNL